MLLLTLETAIACFLWSMNTSIHNENPWGLVDLCPWDVKNLPYRGLCTHPAVSEPVCGSFDLTAQQLEAIAKEIKERRRLICHKARVKSCAKKRAEDPIGYVAHGRERHAQWKRDNPGRMKVFNQKYHQKCRELKKFACTPCDKAFDNSKDLKRHLLTKIHAATVTAAGGDPGPIGERSHCSLCDADFANKYILKAHQLSKGHLRVVEKASQASSKLA